MYNSAGLIPAKFLILIAHLTVCIILLWNSTESVKGCLPENYPIKSFWNQHTQFIVGLGVAVGMIGFEMLAFLTGFTMFHSSSALLSIGCHAGASIFLSYLVFDSWQCGWFWWIFAFCSVLPVLNDICIVVDVLINKNYFYANMIVLSFMCKRSTKARSEIKLEVHRKSVKKGWTKLLLLAGISTTFGLSLPVGYNIGVINSPADIIIRFCNQSIYTRYDAVLGHNELRFLWSAIVSIFLVGGAVGSLTGSWLADNVGRKGAIYASTLLSAAAGLLYVITKSLNSVETLVAGRLLIGLAAGLITCTIPMYLTELAPLKLRGSMGVFCPLGITFGVLVAQVMSLNQILGTEEYWPYLLAGYTVLVILFAMLMPFLPESPKYLLFVKKQPQEAFQQLARIRNLPLCDLGDEIQEMKLTLQNVGDGCRNKWSLIKVITDRTLLLPLLLVCAMQMGQQFSGINAVFYYSVSIFKEAGLSEMNGQLATIGAGCVNLTMSFLCIPIMPYCKRRTVMQISCFSAAFCLLVLALTITYISASAWMPYLCILAVLGFVLCYGIGLGPIPYFIGAELFEVGPRPSAMALGSMANWGGNFLIGLSFPVLQDAIGAGSFIIFAVITLALFIFIRFYLPETKGRDPSEISRLCKHGLSRALDSSVTSTTTVETLPVSDARCDV